MPISRRRAIAAVSISLIALTFGWAQAPLVPGRNINMVSGTTFPDGDPYLQRQNEPSIAVSSRNPLHILAGANDYRAVDLPGQTAANNTGDAWLGVFKSLDGGNTWKSTLLPGCPQNIPACAGSPLKGFEAGADPVIRAGTNGLFYYLGLAFNRGANAPSTIFLARYIDNNNTEAADPIEYLGTQRLVSGNADVFVDKPWIATDIPRAGALTCTVGSQQFPGGNVYVVYTAFRGLNNEPQDVRSTLYAMRSRDCGQTFSNPIAITDGQNLAQGAQIGIDPNTGAVWLTWREIGSGNRPNAIWVSRSTDGGATFSAPAKVADINPFDQGSSSVSFRTNSYPTIALDGSNPARAYIAWSQRGLAPGEDARIAISTSTNGTTWTTPTIAESINERGHQVMPSLVFAGGRLALLYYDQRATQTTGLLRCPTANCTTPAQFAETRPLAGNLAQGQIDRVFNRQLADAAPPTYNPSVDPLLQRQTIDVRVAFASPGPQPSFTSVRVSEYSFGSPAGGAKQTKPIRQTRYNVPNIPLFVGGTRAFMGDYIDLAPSPSFVAVPSGTRTIWRHNISPNTPTVFHAAWTDNRDVIPPRDGDWSRYTAPKNVSASTFNPGAQTPNCEPDRTGMRNQNIYTSRISTGLFVGSPTNAKPLSPNFQRSFIVFLQNTTAVTKHYRINLPNLALPGGEASLLPGASLANIDVTLAPRSSGVRTVYARSTDPRARITVNVDEISSPGGPIVVNGLKSTLVLNADNTNPDLLSPPGSGVPGINEGEFFTPDLTNPDLTNPDLTNPDLTNPDLTNPDLTNPDLTNPDLTNPDLTNPDLTNPGAANPDLTNPVIANPDLTNPDLTNPDLTNNTLTDAIYKVTNRGNTVAPYSIRLVRSTNLPSGVKLQLVIYKVYKTPATKTCSLTELVQNQLVTNLPNPRLLTPQEAANPDLTNPDLTNATFFLEPGQEARVALRILAPTRQAAESIINNVIQPAVTSQAPNTPATPAPPPPAVINIAPTALPDGFINQAYNAAFTPTGGNGSYSWGLAAGALPPGITLNAATGRISGTPTQGGNFTFTVAVRDSANPPATGQRSLAIRIGAPITIVTTSPLPVMKVGVRPFYTLIATGGTGGLNWSVAGGQLPPGVVLNGLGGFEGAPTATGTFNFIARVTDLANPAISRDTGFQVTVIPSPVLLTVTPASGVQGRTVEIEINGENTSFEQGQSQVRAGQNISSTSVTVLSPTQLRATLTIPPNEPIGLSDLRVVTRTESPTRRRIFNTLARPRILAVTPIGAARAQTTTVDLTGAGTGWVQGQVTVSFSGTGVTVTNVQVISPTLLRATINVAANATLSTRSITANFSGTSDTLDNAFVIAEAVGTIQGIVRLPNGNPAPGALVRLYQGSPLAPIAILYANVLGNFEFRGVPAGAFALYGVDAAVTQAGSATGTIATNGQLLSRDIPLGGTANVSFVVTDRQNNPVPNARIYIAPDGESFPVELLSEFSFPTLTTNSAGQATASGLPLLAYIFSAHDAAILRGGEVRPGVPLAAGSNLIPISWQPTELVSSPLSVFNGDLSSNANALPTGRNELTSLPLSVFNGDLTALPTGANELVSSPLSIFNGDLTNATTLPAGRNELVSSPLSVRTTAPPVAPPTLPRGENMAVSPRVVVNLNFTTPINEQNSVSQPPKPTLATQPKEKP